MFYLKKLVFYYSFIKGTNSVGGEQISRKGFVNGVVQKFELRAPSLLGRHFTTCTTSPALFALVIFQAVPHIFVQASLRA
jgi:hypothetical protein